LRKYLSLMKTLYLKSILFGLLTFLATGLSYGQITENFDTGLASSYTTDSQPLNSGVWTIAEVFQESSGNSRGSSGAAARLNDDTSGAHLTTPSLNTVGTVTFWYRELNSGGGTFELQKSTNGSTYTTIDSQTFSGTTYTQYTFNVDDSSSNITLRILNDDQAGHLIIDDFETTAFSGGGGNSAPNISNITQAPATGITSSDAVTVSADVTDSDGTINNVELNWGTTSGSLGNTINMSNTSGDTYETDSDIPAQSDGTTVYYEITATDDEPETTTSAEQSYDVKDLATFPYSEDFTGQNGKGATGGSTVTFDLTGVDWTIDIIESGLGASSDWFRVENEEFSARDVDEEQVWNSPVIDISGETDVDITIDVSSVIGELESNDYIETGYVLDGGSFTTITKHDGEITGAITDSESLTGLSNSTLKIVIKVLNGAGAEYYYFDNISVDAPSTTPSITLSETTLTGLDYVDGSGPSAEQTFTAEGSNLTGDITLTAPTDFEISTTSGSGFGSSVTLTETSGSVSSTTIYVRLASGSAVNTYSGTLTATSTGATQQDVSLNGEVTASGGGGTTTIAFEDFDGSLPTWPNTTDVDFFDNGFGSDGFYGIIDISLASPLNYSSFSNNVLGENDLDDEGDNGTTGFATTTFESVSVENFSNVTLSFDWQVIGYNANDDDAKYEILVDGVSQEETFLVDGGNDPEDGSGSVNFSVPANSSTLSLIISIRNNGGSGYSGFDNFKIEGNYDGDLIYSGGTWSPNAPSASTGTDDALVQEGTYSTSGDISLNAINVLGGATVEISSIDVLTINNGIFNNGDFIFKSDASGTAQVADATGATINGDVTVERFIPVATEDTRAFRFLTSAVNSTDPIYDNWQESGNSPSGYGTHITGNNDGTNGVDQTATGNPSMYTFDNQNTNGGGQDDDWEAVTDTKGNDLIAGEAYRIFIRGDRNYNLDAAPNDADFAPNTDVTLRATGSLALGDQSYNLNQNKDEFSLVGNPYQAIVDMSQVTSNNIKSNFYYVWDPNISGNNERGGYVTVNIGDNSSTGTSTANMFVMPGQSFFVQTQNNGTADITFSETDKAVNETATTVFNDDDQFTLDLLLYHGSSYNNGGTEADALTINFQTGGNNAVDQMDADKIGNPGENIARLNNNNYLSIENRALPVDDESLELFSDGLGAMNYIFVADLADIPSDVSAYLVDDHTGDQTFLSEGENDISFTADPSSPGSVATDRFSIEFDVETFGVEDNDFADNFKVYPNPVENDQITIQATNMSGEVNISLSNMLGQRVMSTKGELTGNGEMTLDIGDQQSGVYFIEVGQDGQNAKERLIIK